MATAQITLTATQSKWLIAYCISKNPLFVKTKDNHRILFKGSTTVSALTQLISEQSLRICGRVTENGMKSNKTPSTAPHWLLYNKGEFINVDSNVEEIIKDFGKNDLYISGANAIDAFGNAALLIGSAGGGGYGKCMGAIYTEGFKTLILAVSDKLIMGDLNKMYGKVARKGCDYSFGMACGLAPVYGDVITEDKAIMAAFPVEAFIYSAGGMANTEYISAVQISGNIKDVEAVLELVKLAKTHTEPMGDSISLEECSYPSVGCGNHLSCVYAKKNTICK